MNRSRVSGSSTLDAPGAQGAARARRRYHDAGDALEIEAARSAVAASLFPTLDTTPTSVGRYLLRRRLGAGGMGIVFAAEDPSLRRDLAIKLLHPKHEASAYTDMRLLKEAQNTAQLVHPCVVTVFDAGLHEDRVFIAMELVDGQTMSEWLASRPPWRHAAAVLAKAARGVEAAHARGIIHRDFKPANVLLGWDGRVCVADFGLAQEIGDASFADVAITTSVMEATGHALTGSGDVVGTPAYMAPEQYLGTVQDERTDQFAFCVSLYEALWGRRPFDARTVPELRDCILTSAPPTPLADRFPEALVNAVSRGLSKQRRDRFAHMGELAELLESLSAEVDLAEIFRQRKSVELGPATSTYDAYLRMLPDGLDTTPEARLPSRVTLIIIAQKPLTNPPKEMVPVIESLYTEPTIPAVHGRALLSAFYDEHFSSLEQFADFMGPVSQTVMKVLFGLSSVPSPSSPHYVQALVSIYTNSVEGMDLSVVAAEPHVAIIQVEHPANTVNDVVRVSIAEVIRAAMLVTGCTIVEVATVERAADQFRVKAQWR